MPINGFGCRAQACLRASALVAWSTVAACFANGQVPGGTADAQPATTRAVFSGYPTSGLRRLTTAQYTNSVMSLLGSDFAPRVALDADSVGGDVLRSESASTLATTPHGADQYDLSAQDLAARRFATQALAADFVGCTPSLDPNDACVATFVRTFGLRAWRRPVTPDEFAAYTGAVPQFAALDGNVWTAMRMLTAAFLESPNFLYRSELGVPDPNGYRVLDSFELATRLAYLLTNSTPSDALLASAASGALSTPAGLLDAASRMLNDPRAPAAFVDFLGDWLDLDSLASRVPSDPNLFAYATPTLGASMRQEVGLMATDLVFNQNADFRDLFTRNTTFVNGDLAALYGLPGQGNAFVPVQWPQNSPRGGLFTSAAFLSSQSTGPQTSPTRRGLYIVQRIQCRTLSPPPAGAGMLPPADPNAGPQTMRQKLNAHRTQAACAACHTLMDPMGLTLEHFEAYGTYRATDQGLFIDASGEVDGQAYVGTAQMANIMRGLPEVQQCIVRHVYRQALGQHETADAEPFIASLTQQFAQSGFRMQALLLSIVSSDAFRTAQELR